MIDAGQRRYILDRAYVSEHSPDLMTIVSGGEAHLYGGYVVYSGDGWAVVNGYPLEGPSDGEGLEEAVERANARFSPRYLWLVAPGIPAGFRKRICERETDEYYRLDLSEFDPSRRLMREVERAAERLVVERTRAMGPDHESMTVEFIRHVDPHERVSGLYQAMPDFVRRSPDALVLDARTREGRLAAFYVMDMAPTGFASYVVGCHSRTVRAPHASDLLFVEMVAAARGAGKRYIDLGLGVHDGIRRFKTKWGAEIFLPYEMCEIELPRRALSLRPLSPGSGAVAKNTGLRAIIGSFPFLRRRGAEYKMLWEVRKGEALNLLGGTAHFFCRSYRRSFERLLSGVDRVLFEGPLGEESMRLVRERGSVSEGGSRLFAELGRETRSKIAHEFAPRGLRTAIRAGLPPGVRDSIEDEICHGRLDGMKPWLAFFSMWSEFLMKRGWVYSVDLEAYETAGRLGKEIIQLELIEEQIEAMEGIPFDGIVEFLGRIDRWEAMARLHARRFMAGDIDRIFGALTNFPSRCESIIDRRDPVFFERMTPFIEKGGSAVLLGTGHMPGIMRRLGEAGWSVRPVGR